MSISAAPKALAASSLVSENGIRHPIRLSRRQQETGGEAPGGAAAAQGQHPGTQAIWAGPRQWQTQSKAYVPSVPVAGRESSIARLLDNPNLQQTV